MTSTFSRTRILAWVAGCVGVWAVLCAGTGRCEILFSREHIKVFVREHGLRVEGSYVFANPDSFPIQQWLFYPFPVDSLHGAPVSIDVRSAGKSVAFHSEENGIYFPVVLTGKGSGVVDVCYEQTCIDSSGCYILKSTARWDAPLESANFEVRVPDTIHLDWMAYGADSVETSNGVTIYRFSRKDFKPQEDLCLRWHVVGN